MNDPPSMLAPGPLPAKSGPEKSYATNSPTRLNKHRRKQLRITSCSVRNLSTLWCIQALRQVAWEQVCAKRCVSKGRAKRLSDSYVFVRFEEEMRNAVGYCASQAAQLFYCAHLTLHSPHPIRYLHSSCYTNIAFTLTFWAIFRLHSELCPEWEFFTSISVLPAWSCNIWTRTFRPNPLEDISRFCTSAVITLR